MPPSDLRPEEIVDWTDAQLDEVFRRAETLPIDVLVNAGGHRVDVARHDIYNDAHWKGFLPKGLPIRDMFERLATGYAKRFWRQKERYLGETIYLNGGILVKHALEEVTIDRRTNDLDPGHYVLLRYTDPVFEHMFYDVMKIVTSDLILYRGYLGRFPDGRRGLTGPLMRRFTFAQMGTADHAALFEGGSAIAEDDLMGSWQIDAIATSNHLVRVAQLEVTRTVAGQVSGVCDSTAGGQNVILPTFVAEHFQGDVFSSLRAEARRVDAEYIVGRWTTDIAGPYAKLLLGGSAGLFHVERRKGARRRFTMHYVLRRTR